MQRLVQAGHIQWTGMTHKHLAREIQAKPTMFQTALGDTAFKYRTLATTSPTKLIGTTTTIVPLKGVAHSAVATTYGGQTTALAVM